MAKFVAGTTRDRLMAAFADAVGIDHNYVTRIVVDLKVGDVARVYFSTMANDDVLEVIERGGGIEIVDTAEEALAA